ncbi:hypothetical protein [Candidatus Mesenet endosymbiont of Phosphuga atrata]
MTESIREDVDIASIIKTEVNKLNCDKLRAQESKTKDVTSKHI